MAKTRIASAQKIVTAAELYFDGLTQTAIAQKLGLHQSRISQMQSTEPWQQTITRLESLKQKAEAEAEKRQQLLYSTDFDRRFEQSRLMMKINAEIAAKLMAVVAAALDEARGNPDKVQAIEQLKQLPNLIKAALALQQEAMGRHYDEVEALKILAEAGWLPRSVLKLANDETSKLKSNLREAFIGIMPDRPEEQQGRGLTAETAEAIKRHLLGIEASETEPLAESEEY